MLKPILRLQKQNPKIYFLIVVFSVFFFLTPETSFSFGYFALFLIFLFFAWALTISNFATVLWTLKGKLQKKHKLDGSPINIERFSRVYASTVKVYSIWLLGLVIAKPFFFDSTFFRVLTLIVLSVYLLIKVAKRLHIKGYGSMENYFLTQFVFFACFTLFFPVSFFITLLASLLI